MRRSLWIVFLLLVSVAGHALGATPFIDQISPAAAQPGAGPLVLTIHGANFSPSAKVSFGSQTFVPDSISAGRIAVTIHGASLSQAGTINVSVLNLPQAGATNSSNKVQFSFVKPVSTISLARPNSYAPNAAGQIATADFNNDGRPDFVSIDVSAVDIIASTPQGGLQALTGVRPGSAPQAITTADFNGDGDVDFAVACLGGILTIALGNGAGGFTVSNLQTNAWGYAISIVSADFDGDGHPDLAVAGDVPAFSTASILMGDGMGRFTFRPAAASGLPGFSLTTGDFNNDGIVDLVATLPKNGYNLGLTFLAGTGTGSFQGRTAITLQGSFSATAGDFDGDGKLDLVLADGSNTGRVYRGDGAGGFTLTGTLSVPAQTNYCTTGDFNGDGYTDAAFSGQNGLAIYAGDGKGGFQQDFSSFLDAGSFPIATDVNNDGLKDFALALAKPATFAVIPQKSAVPTPGSYTITDLCAPALCELRVLGPTGTAAGADSVVYANTNSVFTLGDSGFDFYPASINASDIIAGSVPMGFAGGGYAALALPFRTSLVNLDSVFNWPGGFATYVNDLDQVVGFPNFNGQTVDTLVPNHQLRTVYALTDSGIVIGYDADGILVWTPDGTPAGRVERLSSSPGYSPQSLVFNSRGQILVNGPYLGELFTPGRGITQQAGPANFFAAGFNSSDQFVGIVQNRLASAPSFYTADGGVIPLASLLPAGSGWNIVFPAAINDAGQILALANHGSGALTSVLLNPPNPLLLQSRAETEERSPRSVCPSFNSRRTPALCGSAPVR